MYLIQYYYTGIIVIYILKNIHVLLHVLHCYGILRSLYNTTLKITIFNSIMLIPKDDNC